MSSQMQSSLGMLLVVGVGVTDGVTDGAGVGVTDGVTDGAGVGVGVSAVFTVKLTTLEAVEVLPAASLAVAVKA